MSVPAAAVALVEEFEGFSAEPYLCPAGVWTIGFGSTHGVTADTPPVTREEARELTARDLESFAQCVEHATHDTRLTDNQKAALCSFVYNVGPGNFTSSTLLRKLNAGDYAGAAAQFDVWNRGGGKVLAGLVRRRAAERKLFETA